MNDWRHEGMELPHPKGAGDWLRVVWRGGLIGILTFGGLLVLLVLRLAERPLYGLRRPWTGRLTRWVCRANVAILGLGYRVEGAEMAGRGAVVSNHVSWLDIFTLNACTTGNFIAKSEVAGWAGIGWLARATGTMFVIRKGTEAKAQQVELEGRLAAGQHLIFFPEGTSTDGQRVLPFKSSLFAAFQGAGLAIQPVTIVYEAPAGADPRYYGWWAEMEFGPSLLMVLASPRQGRVVITRHAPLHVGDFADRKALTAAAEAAVRSAHPQG
ncbi:lysophospholipid acyltransferase family protein [Neogemmobacter tilapiae]|uniref:1-acyl-sn-glycerol-3-phosphate acyltransferase n=1 Tax=Neogemmobacter tilapiae TaxID=875041 RepID=A0A918TUP8_9RHOB|nr:lysophospholipid acyltransferase family protein [Gemmobacter tilapiae]GHC62805.1 1-acyl-sn-glycerol-3-phosphate acyltransferase [Gemmobacter tilapiae]